MLVTRTPVINHQQDLLGYRLHLHATNSASEDPTVRLVQQITELEARISLGDKMIFLPLHSPENLLNHIDHIKHDRFVFVYTVDETPIDTDAIMKIREHKIGICLQQFSLKPETADVLNCTNFIEVPFATISERSFAEMAWEVRKFPIKFIATGVDTKAEFEQALQAKMDAVESYYFVKPATLTAKTINPSYGNIFNLMNMLRDSANMKKIEEALKRDVALSFKLLKYINSAGFGLSCEIKSFAHAVSMLGYENLYRWLSLLLVTAGKDFTAPVLMKNATLRGRLMELLGQSHFKPADRDNLFIIGLFSMLDSMMQMPIAEVINQLSIAENIRDALLEHSGIYGPFLELAIALETADIERAQSLITDLQLSNEEVNSLHLEAMAWVESVGI